ncbi:hypothetical protein AB0I35_20570 [Nocardia sp. NPDC050378]|uniref:hypothetical protein n=1 Tax=Nocardia sp. NPDC050378 TaxID=3155400 RepID=UPI0033D9C22B
MASDHQPPQRLPPKNCPAATVATVLSHRIGLGTEYLTMHESGDPLSVPGFSVDLDVDPADPDEDEGGEEEDGSWAATVSFVRLTGGGELPR